MQKKLIDTGQSMMESTVIIGNCALAIESQPVRDLCVTQKRLEKFSNIVKVDFPEKSGYRRIGKYRVKETFAGEERLTSLLTQYVERTVAIRY